MTDDWRPCAFEELAQALSAGMVWEFGRIGGPVYSKFFRLWRNGRIGGYADPNESSWALTETGLVLRGRSGETTTVFNVVERSDARAYRLTGDFVGVPGTGLRHYLRQVVDPYALSSDPAQFKLDRQIGSKPRRNLVFMGANEHSLHYQWPRNISNEDRSWDLAVSFYGQPEDIPGDEFAEFVSYQTGVRKFKAIYSAMHEMSRFWDYERIFIIDDDIMTSWLDINRFLEICRELDLTLAQPALQADCCINHPITAQEPDCLIRFTNFVECMAPCFTSTALRDCVPILRDSVYGFGTDHMWPRILGIPKNKIGIVDAVAIDHTRPLATTYSFDAGMAEERRLLAVYGVDGPLEIFETGRISRTDARARR